jgi:glycosyltransferase involved in cell wall biosynthesis
MESQGLVIIEAMAGSKAVVTGQVGPGPEIIEDGISGLLCDPHDPASIAGKIIAALKDRPLRLQLGAAASARAEHLFSIPVIADRMAEYYRGCIANGSRH